MKDESMNREAGRKPDPAWSPLYRVGALSAFLYLVLVLVPLVLLVAFPQPPVAGGAALLEYIGAHRGLYLVELVCFVGLSLPAIFVFLALGIVLFPLGKNLALLGALVGLVSEIIALALGSSPPSLNGGLLVLSGQYASAGESLRASLAAAAEGLAAGTNAVSSAGILTALGILLLSIVMLKGSFPRATAILGIVTGGLGIFLEALRPLIGMVYALFGLLLPLWFLAVGLRLNRIARGR